MNFIKTKLIKLFFLLSLQGFVSPTICFSVLPDFLDDSEPQGMSLLQRDIKIPIGFKDDAVQYVVLPTGTPLTEIAPKISQKREELDLTPHIPLDQQDAFFQDYLWQTTKDKIVTTSMAGRIIQLFVRKGQHVERGERLCVIEAMKMQNTINSSYAGEIKNISVEENTVTSSGSTLMCLLPTSPDWGNINQEHILQNKDLLIPFFPWATSVPTEIPPSPLEPSPGGGKICNPIAEENNQHIEPLQEGSIQSPSLPLMESSFSELIEEEGALETQSFAPLPVLLLDPIILPVATEQESEQFIPMNYDTPHPQDKLATSPTRGEVSLIQDSFLPAPSEEGSQIVLDSPLPLWERSPLTAGEGLLSKNVLNTPSLSEVSSLTPRVSVNELEELVLERLSPPSSMVELVHRGKEENLLATEKSELVQIISEEDALEAQTPTPLAVLLIDPIILPIATEQESQAQTPNIFNTPALSESSTITPQVSVNELEELVLERLSLPSPIAELVDKEKTETVSVSKKNDLKSMPFTIKTVFAWPMKTGIISVSIEIPKNVHNFPNLRQVEKISPLLRPFDTRLAPAPAKEEDDGGLLRTVVKQIWDDNSLGLNTEFRKRSINEKTHPLQEESSSFKSKVSLKEKATPALVNETNFHIWRWAKDICGLIALSILIFAAGTINKYILLNSVKFRRLYYAFFLSQKLLFLNATYFNTYRLTLNQVASNRNHRRWIGKKAV